MAQQLKKKVQIMMDTRSAQVANLKQQLETKHQLKYVQQQLCWAQQDMERVQQELAASRRTEATTRQELEAVTKQVRAVMSVGPPRGGRGALLVTTKSM